METSALFQQSQSSDRGLHIAQITESPPGLIWELLWSTDITPRLEWACHDTVMRLAVCGVFIVYTHILQKFWQSDKTHLVNECMSLALLHLIVLSLLIIRAVCLHFFDSMEKVINAFQCFYINWAFLTMSY